MRTASSWQIFWRLSTTHILTHLLFMTPMQSLRYHYSDTPTYDKYLDTPSSSNIDSATPDMNLSGGSVAQHAENDEETSALFESLLNNCSIELRK